MSAIPSAQDLVTERFLPPPRTARGVYLDRRPGRPDVHMRFSYVAPDRWLWLHNEDSAAGALTDGTTNVVIEDDVAIVVTDGGEVHTSSRLTNLFRPSFYDYSGWEFGPLSAGTVIGRSAWIVAARPGTPGKPPHEVTFDAETAVILSMRTGDPYLGFEELTLDEAIPEETFRWDGPVEARKVGVAYGFRDEDGSFQVHWEVSVRSRLVFSLTGPRAATKEGAIAWGDERAARTLIRDP